MTVRSLGQSGSSTRLTVIFLLYEVFFLFVFSKISIKIKFSKIWFQVKSIMCVHKKQGSEYLTQIFKMGGNETIGTIQTFMSPMIRILSEFITQILDFS